MRRLSVVILTLGGIVLAGPAAFAQSAADELPWSKCPCVADLGNATLDLPAGMSFLHRASVPRFMELLENPVSGHERGIVLGESESHGTWFVVFSFSDTGYVRDDEKTSLDADDILASIRRSNEAANRERARRGWTTINVDVWLLRPFYDAATNNLTWAIRGSGESGPVVNHSVRLLGRRGVMSAELVVAPDGHASTMPVFATVVRGFDFNSGARYREFTRGDRVAEFGLTALVAGGAGAALAKSGLLGKIWKLLVFGAIAVLAAIKRLLASAFGGRRPAEDSAAGG